MSDSEIPFWTISTSEAPPDVPASLLQQPEQGFTPERLERVRRVLTAYADDPPVLLERHPVVVSDLPSGGRTIPDASPLALALQNVIGSARTVTAPEKAIGATGTLYRMVVPKEVAGDLACGLARSMSAGKDGAVYSGILGKAGLVANAKFVPVAASGAGGAAATTTAAVTLGGVAVAAAPFVVLLAATAASVHAEEQRRQALQRLQSTLDEMRAESLAAERDQVNGAVSAIAKATAVLADEGRLGHSLGLDAAVFAIDTALSTAERRLAKWEVRLRELGGSATPDALEAAFPGIGQENGEFRAKLRLAAFAIATKRRVAVLQAAEHTQLNPQLSLKRFAGRLRHDIEELESLEDRLADLLQSLAALTIEPPSRRRDVVFTPKEVRRVLAWAPRLDALARTESPGKTQDGDVELALVVSETGRIRVLPPALAAVRS